MIYDPRSIQLSPEQQEKVAAYAERTGRPWQEVVDQVVSRITVLDEPSLPEGESLLDAFKRVGAVGCFSSGLGDLSTNPKYMEGFGESNG